MKPIKRNLGWNTFGRTEEGIEKDYQALIKRLAKEEKQRANQPAIPDTNPEQQRITLDDNPPQASLIQGWLYVPSIGMEFAPDLNELGSNWYDAHKLVRAKGFIMPSPAETWGLFFEAKANLQKPEFRKIYEFFTKKTPKNTWHGEWQDAYFKKDGDKMYMHRLEGFNAKGEPKFQAGIDITGNYLTKDGYADISKKSNITPEGLCNSKDLRTDYTEGENIYQWYPRDERVARFDAGSGRVGLDCDWGGSPQDADASFGVRFARRVAPSISRKSGGSK